MSWESPFPTVSPFSKDSPAHQAAPGARGRHAGARPVFELPVVPLTSDSLAQAADALPVSGERSTYEIASVDALLTRAIVTLGALEHGLASPSPVTSDEVAHAHFAMVLPGRGYDVDAVDALMGAVAATLPDQLPEPTAPVPAPVPATVLSVEQLREQVQALPRAKFGPRYDVGAVEAYLPKVVDALTAYEAGQVGELTAEDLLDATFPQTKFREGYTQDGVDDLLDKVIEQLRV